MIGADDENSVLLACNRVPKDEVFKVSILFTGEEPNGTLKRLQREKDVLKQEAPEIWCLPEYFAQTRLINYF